QVVKNEVSRRTVVGDNAAYFGRRHEYVLRPRFREEALDGALLRQVEVGMAPKDKIFIPGRTQTPDQGGAHEAAMTRNVNGCVRVHIYSC
ncbi:MAG TPA: hypothetical protein VK579_17390, partial [Terriglobales bacterium]|nr:hypothetical protein [Terriglobales bacterium]